MVRLRMLQRSESPSARANVRNQELVPPVEIRRVGLVDKTLQYQNMVSDGMKGNEEDKVVSRAKCR